MEHRPEPQPRDTAGSTVVPWYFDRSYDSPDQVTRSRQSADLVHAQFLRALDVQLAGAAPSLKEARRKPLEASLARPLPSKVHLYAWFLRADQKSHSRGEVLRIQVLKQIERVDGVFPLLAGWDVQRNVWVLYEAAAHENAYGTMSSSKSCFVSRSTIAEALTKGMAAENRPIKGRPQIIRAATPRCLPEAIVAAYDRYLGLRTSS